MSAPAWRWWWGLSSEEAVESVWTTGLSRLLSWGLPERVEVCACPHVYKEEGIHESVPAQLRSNPAASLAPGRQKWGCGTQGHGQGGEGHPQLSPELAVLWIGTGPPQGD